MKTAKKNYWVIEGWGYYECEAVGGKWITIVANKRHYKKIFSECFDKDHPIRKKIDAIFTDDLSTRERASFVKVRLSGHFKEYHSEDYLTVDEIEVIK